MAAPNDCGAEGIKNATLEWSHAWYVGVALAMSVAFAMLIFRPARINRDETHPLDEQIALYVYLGFTLRACYLSLGILLSCAVWVQQASAVPAADYSKFLAACTLETKPYLDDPGDMVPCLFGQLLIAVVPLCYLEYGLLGMCFGLAAFGRYITMCARCFNGWQRAMQGFEARLGVERGTYMADWGGYGAPTWRGQLLCVFHVVVGAYPSDAWADWLYAGGSISEGRIRSGKNVLVAPAMLPMPSRVSSREVAWPGEHVTEVLKARQTTVTEMR